MTANDDLLDLALRHEVEARRFARGVERRVLSILAKSDATMRARLLKALAKVDAGKFNVKDLSQLVANMRAATARAMNRAQDTLEKETDDYARHEVQWTARAINEATPVAFDIEEPEPERVSFDGKTLSGWFSALEADQVKRLAATVRLGIAQGSTTEEIARAIAEAFDVSRGRARTLVRTAVTAAGTQARQKLLDANKSIIKGVRWVSTLDGRTSAVCRARDGEVYPVDKGPRPPAHPNCRSVVVPILKSWRELGFDDLDENDRLSERPFVRDKRQVKDIPKSERAALIGRVKASERYQDWLARQPASFQDDVLGKVKGALFRRGGLTLDRFVDGSGHEYSIDELRRREAAAFRKAGVD